MSSEGVAHELVGTYDDGVRHVVVDLDGNSLSVAAAPVGSDG
ncbi:MAG: hypothetical protein QM621_02735 [Aeromicrobium sp.]